MSYYIQKGDLPTWHNSYVAGSTVYVEAFAIDNTDTNTNAKYLKSGEGTYLNDIGNQFTDYVTSDLFINGPVLKGCGLNFEKGVYETRVYAGGKPPSQNNLSSPNDTPPVGSTKTVTLSRTGSGTLTIDDDGDVETCYNVPPLIYFEICGGGGGGAGKTSSGSGGGSGAGSIAGILNFTQSTNFIITIGGGGGGSFGAYNTGSGADGANGGDTILQNGTSFNSMKQHLIAKGGQGGPRPTSSADNRFATGGKAGIRARSSSSISEFPSSNTQACSHSVLVLRTIQGGRGGRGGSFYETSYTSTDRKGADVTASAIATLDLKSGTHIVDPVSNKVGGSCGTDWQTNGGGGGASAFGSGGRGQGTYSGTRGVCRDGSNYGSGGGGAGGPGSVSYYYGGNGAPGKLYLAWIPYTEVAK